MQALSHSRGQRTQICDEILKKNKKKTSHTKARRGCLFAPLGGSKGTVPPELTGGNRPVTLVSFVIEEECYFLLRQTISAETLITLLISFSPFLLVDLLLVLSYMHQSGLHVSKKQADQFFSVPDKKLHIWAATFWVETWLFCYFLCSSFAARW